MTSTTQGRAARRRGHVAECRVAAYLRDHGFPDAATSRSALGHDGTRQPGDIVGVPGLCIDVKDVARSAFPTWLRQARAEAEPGGLIPVVVRRTRGNPDVGEWIAVVSNGTRPFDGSCRTVLGSIHSVKAHLERSASWTCGGEGCPPMVALTDGWTLGEWNATRFAHVVTLAEGMAP